MDSSIFEFILWLLLPVLPFIFFAFSKKLFGKEVTYEPGYGYRGQYAKVTSHELNRNQIKLNKKVLQDEYAKIEKHLVENESLAKYDAFTFKKSLEATKAHFEDVLYYTVGYFPKRRVKKDIKFIQQYIDKVDSLIKIQ